jgi:hypothetical protein
VKFLLIGVVLILAIWARSAIRSMARRYKPLFSDVHYLELIEKAHTLRGAALENINCKLLNPNDPRRSLTSEGIGIIYTIEQAGGLFFHHLSFSRRGGYLPFAAGGRFLYVMASSVGILVNLWAVAHSRNGIIHGGFLLSETEQRINAAKTCTIPPADQIPQIKIDTNKWFERFWRTNKLLRSEEELKEKMSDNKSGVKWI